MVNDIERAAHNLVAHNVEAEPNLEAVYLFPAEDEIRLIELDPTALPSEEIAPFYFDPDPRGGIPYRMAIALILPEERDRLAPPSTWGSWEDARIIWHRNGG